MALYSAIQKFITKNGAPVAGASCLVFVDGSTTQPTLYSGRAGGSLGNPFQTDSQGNALCFVAPGRYKMIVTKDGDQVTFEGIEVGPVSLVGDFAAGGLVSDPDQWFMDQYGNQWAWTGSLNKTVAPGEDPNAVDGWLLVLEGDKEPSKPQALSFAGGGVVKRPFNSIEGEYGSEWRWAGSLPKTVAPGTDPASDALYVPVGASVLRRDLADGGADVGGVTSGDLAFRYSSELLGDYVELMNWLPKDIAQRAYDGDVTLDMKPYIDTALTLYKHIGLPSFKIYSTGDHDIAERRVSGKSPEFSIIKLMGSNTADVMFRNGVTSISGLGTWGTGLDWSIKDLWVQGNWDGVTGLTPVTVERVNGETGVSSGPYNTDIGVLQADYNFETNKGLIKSINGVRNNIENCRVSLSYEHGLMIYRGGYSLLFDNLIYSNRGSGAWLTADNPENGITSFNLIANKIEGNRGWFGNLRWKYYYGCSIHGNLAEAGNHGLYFEEGAEMDVSGGYSEAATTADVYIDPAAWNINFINHAWFTPPIIPATRGHFIYSKQSGLKYKPSEGAQNNFAGMTFSDDGKFGINTERRVRQLNVRTPLIAPAEPAFSQYAGMRLSGSATDTDDNATTEILTEANASDSAKSRIVFGVNNGSGMQYRARVTEDGHYHTDGSWDGSHFVWGNNHVWVDAAGLMRIKGGAPTSDTDGVIVGSQV